jgi:GNAT superfamily N-acetyltransferase
MDWRTHPVTPDRFEDFADVINPNRREMHCWCVSHRLRQRDIDELGGGIREQAMRALCARENPPGVVTYADGVPVGWCNIGARADNPRLVHSTVMRPVDDVDVWSIVCVVVRGGHRKQGVSGHLIEGAVAYAASRGAPAGEAAHTGSATSRWPMDPEPALHGRDPPGRREGRHPQPLGDADRQPRPAGSRARTGRPSALVVTVL